MELAETIEAIVAVGIILVVVAGIRLRLNSEIYGKRFPFIDLFRRLFQQERSKKAKKQLVHLVLFFILFLSGLSVILNLSRIFR